MVKRSFTVIELIISIVVVSLIVLGTFRALESLYSRYYQANTITKFSINSQVLLDSISKLLYYRIPLSAIGYNPSSGAFEALSGVSTSGFKVFEWMGEAYDAKLQKSDDTSKGYSGFIDLDASEIITRTLMAKDFNASHIESMIQTLFDSSLSLSELTAIVFAGTFDRGDSSIETNFADAFGWHGNSADKIYTIASTHQTGGDNNLTMDASILGNRIFSKFYLVQSAYAIARGADIDTSASCITQKGINTSELNDTLFLFYDYRPWKGESFCADPNGSGQSGKVTILAKEVSAFKVASVGYHLDLRVSFRASFVKGSEKNITVSKQKVAF